MIGVGGKYDRVREAMIFRKCLGLNDIVSLGSQKHDNSSGETELIDCLNVTTTRDGCIEKTPAYTTVITHSAPVVSLSADSRFMFQDAIDTNEWNGTSITQPFALVTGEICHTALDVRVNNGTTIYKSLNGSVSSSATVLGNLSAIPATSKPDAPV
jgi:hypothetical protein